MNGIWFRYFKRPFDIAICLAALIVLWPVILVTAFVVRRSLGSPILFSQVRLGRDNTQFRLYKFRSMNEEKGPDGVLLPDEERMTPIGRWLRASSLDELPQLISILKGDMSLIGPRATLPAYEDYLRASYPDRFKVLPGLTSLPGVRGRNGLSWNEKFELDTEYVHKVSFRMDAYIFLMTIPVVLGRKGIESSDNQTPTIRPWS